MTEEENKQPKKKRILHPNSFFHIYNRGNRKKQLFYSEKDYRVFLGLLSKYLNVYNQLNLFTYCLMPNHFHLLLKTSSETQDLVKLMHRSMTSYAIYFNKRYQQTGHVFESRYKSKYLPQKKDVKRVFDYITDNPVKAELCRNPEDYKWLWTSELLFLSFKKSQTVERITLSPF